MKTYYEVENRYYNNGKVRATLRAIEGRRQARRSIGRRHYDGYKDYFETLSEAQQHRKSCLNA